MKWIAPLVLSLALAGCGGSPTAPSAPNFQGAWSGIWLLQSCTETGVASGNFCKGLAGSGPLSVSLTQSGSSVQGSLNLGSLQTPVSGPIGASGILTLTGQATTSLGTLTLQSWHSTVSTTMAGDFAFTIDVPITIGIGRASVTGALQGVVRTN